MISAKAEEEISALDAEEQELFLADMGLTESGLTERHARALLSLPDAAGEP